MADHIVVFNTVRTSNIKPANEPFKVHFEGGGLLAGYVHIMMSSCILVIY